MKRVTMLCIALMVHLHLFAGGSIRVNTFSPLKPVISVSIPHAVAKKIAGALQEKGKDVLGLYMIIHDTPAAIAVSGAYTLAGHELSFTPAYALGHNTEFEVQYSESGAVLARKRFVTEPSLPGAELKVEQVFPVTDTVPVNTLFFHVRFNNRMRPIIEAYKKVRVYNAEGVEQTEAWRQKSFWVDSGKLLVLMVHPGRVKTGIDYGGALFEKGKYYTIKVDKSITDINGGQLASDYTRSFYIKEADKTSPKVHIDTTHLPVIGSTGALVLKFNEGVDYASVVEGLTVLDAKNTAVPCHIHNDGDASYRIVPTARWKKQAYTLVLKPAIYDFAANRLYRLFEVSDKKEFENDDKHTALQFRAVER